MGAPDDILVIRPVPSRGGPGYRGKGRVGSCQQHKNRYRLGPPFGFPLTLDMGLYNKSQFKKGENKGTRFLGDLGGFPKKSLAIWAPETRLHGLVDVLAGLKCTPFLGGVLFTPGGFFK